MFTLALALGRTVAELERTLTSSEFSEWMAYYELEPFGAWRDNLHAAQIAALLYNVNRERGSPAKSPGDFIYRDRVAAQEEADREMLVRLEAVAVRAR